MEGAKDPIHLTYYMIDWNNTGQSPSENVCVRCGMAMLRVQAITTESGVAYEGRVCHGCKSLFWVRKD